MRMRRSTAEADSGFSSPSPNDKKSLARTHSPKDRSGRVRLCAAVCSRSDAPALTIHRVHRTDADGQSPL